ncbi:hypothetical protein FRACYDRAFT_205530 [Fragilariopsis cylindrus CCMP1102]|uniref:G-protein coupled receptors family 1 profile domain-containing protein n=1 Tax=Fragilariopsis cylindrus CCMP1102 TaxID=635003 RepID=A0A1E7FXQ4_9STRA|nr:hypothetical protein FRACYDRAFT_205530 [Fragilariopsis cylindrus CCMP1102]|eukprot:OEU22915.1 hypothetical protein FRACYDRAFT_205530 [Fragilariopsis cylindrus CCMP1102]
MSIIDVFVSIAYMFSTIPSPKSSYEVIWAFGNIQTCTAQGFFIQLGIIPPIYHVCLSIYFLLIVNLEVTEDTIARYVEPLMHVAALGFGFGTAIASIVLDLFNNATIWCWIARLPYNCTDSFNNDSVPILNTCARGDNSYIYRYAFFLVPLWMSMFAVLGINIAIFRVVRKREAKADNLHAIHHAKYGQTAASGLDASGSEGKQYAAAYHISARVIKVQSIAFVVGFWMIWLLPTINRLIREFKPENYFVLIFFQAFFEPLQGVFNVIIYRILYYIRLKQRYPRWTTRELLRRTYRWTFLGPPKGDPAERV